MNPLSPKPKDIVDDARASISPSKADQARVWERLGQRLAVASTVVSSVPGTKHPPPTVGTSIASGTLTKVILAVAVLSISGGALIWRATRSHVEPTAHVSVLARAVELPVTAPTSAPPPVAPTAVPTADTQPVAAIAPPAITHGRPSLSTQTNPSSTGLADEIELISAAHLALSEGHASQALRILHQHAQQFSHGNLVDEREVEIVAADCALGRVRDARIRAHRILQNAPQSPYARRLAGTCALLAEADAGTNH